MYKSYKNGVLVIGVLLAIVLAALTSCKTEPPVDPVLPDIMGCSVTGDVLINYTSKKGNIQKNIDNLFPRRQYQFSSYATIEGHPYNIVVSIFFDSTLTAPYSVPVEAKNDSITFNQAWIAFVVDINDTKNKLEYWAESGTVYIDSLILGGSRNFVKARYNCSAVERNSKKTIQITDGWAYINRQF